MVNDSSGVLPWLRDNVVGLLEVVIGLVAVILTYLQSQPGQQARLKRLAGAVLWCAPLLLGLVLLALGWNTASKAIGLLVFLVWSAVLVTAAVIRHSILSAPSAPFVAPPARSPWDPHRLRISASAPSLKFDPQAGSLSVCATLSVYNEPASVPVEFRKGEAADTIMTLYGPYLAPPVRLERMRLDHVYGDSTSGAVVLPPDGECSFRLCANYPLTRKGDLGKQPSDRCLLLELGGRVPLHKNGMFLGESLPNLAPLHIDLAAGGACEVELWMKA